MKILFFARDPGGANTIIPVIKKMSDAYDTVCFAKDVAFQRLRTKGIACENIQEYVEEITEASVENFLKEQRANIVVTSTSLDDFTERYLWKAAKRMKIFSIAILDQWMNMGIRFSKYSYCEKDMFEKKPEYEFCPDRICVMDEIGKRLLIEEGISKEKICVTGQPHFDTIKESYQCMNKKAKSLMDEKMTVVYASEPLSKDYDNGKEDNPYYGFNEHTIFDNLVESLMLLQRESKIEIDLIIRPHPRENIDYWDNFVKHNVCKGINICYDKVSDTFELLGKSDIVCGMSSMFLLEAAICEIPIISIMIGLTRENPFILDKIGLCKSAKTQEELMIKFEEILSGKKSGLEFAIVDNPTDNVLKVICDNMFDLMEG